jgi:hypothetical protein
MKYIVRVQIDMVEGELRESDVHPSGDRRTGHKQDIVS